MSFSCLDTDGDGLTDGVESGTNTYVSPTDTGTDPNLPDTDGDPYSDNLEVTATVASGSAPKLFVRLAAIQK